MNISLQATLLGYAMPFPTWIRYRLRQLLSHVWLFGANITDNSTSIEQEFMALIAKENPTISKICFSFANSVTDYDDLRQDALINIWRGMNTFRCDATHRTWIYRVTLNSCLSTIRKQSRHQHESLEQLYGMIDASDDNKEEIELLYRIIASLDREDRAIIMMWLDEMSYDDIAETMGLNRNTVATRIKRAKEKITHKFQEEIKL